MRMRKSRWALLVLFALLDVLVLGLVYRLSFDIGVEGIVLDAGTGLPVENPRIWWDSTPVETTSAGKFRIVTGRGTHHLRVEAPGYIPHEQDVNVEFFSFNPPLEIKLEPRVIRGMVLDKLTHTPVSGATVRLGRLTLTTDGRGRYRAERLKPPLKVNISADGYIPWQGMVPAPAGSPGEIVTYLEPNVVTGKVLDAIEGFPVAGATVRTEDWTAVTDEAGFFALRRVTQGEVISAEARYYHAASVSYRGREPVEILLKPRILVVKVLDGITHRPVSNARIRIGEQTLAVDSLGRVGIRASFDGNVADVSAPSYVPAEVPISAEKPVITVELAPIRWTLRLVDGSSGEPVTEALVYTPDGILEPEEPGSLTLERIPPGVALIVKAPRYSLARFSLGSSFEAEGAEIRACEPAPCIELALRPFKVKGIYIPFVVLGNPERVRQLLKLVDETELNAVVVDVKGDRGFLAFHSRVPLAGELGVVKEKEAAVLKELLNFCREKGIYTIARMVVFKDHPLATGKPELAVKRGDGSVWTDREGLGWGNPFREEVWEYNIELAKEVASLGFDEIQFDYVRFPSDGDLTAIVYEEENTRETRTAAIREFISRMEQALKPYPVFTSADVFGLTVWVVPGEDMGIGQRVEDISPHVDYLCPMVYPSTFAPGALGYENPQLHPYEVVYRSTLAAWKRSEAVVRPWLQHYSLYGVTYGLEELKALRQAAEDAGAWGWTYWNAGGYYDERLFAKEEGTQAGP